MGKDYLFTYKIKASLLSPEEEEGFEGNGIFYDHRVYSFTEEGNYDIPEEERKAMIDSLNNLVTNSIDRDEDIPMLELRLSKGDDILNKKVTELDVPMSVLFSFEKKGIGRIGDLMGYSVKELMRFWKIGPGRIKNIQKAIKKYGLEIKQ